MLAVDPSGEAVWCERSRSVEKMCSNPQLFNHREHESDNCPGPHMQLFYDAPPPHEHDLVLASDGNVKCRGCTKKWWVVPDMKGMVGL